MRIGNKIFTDDNTYIMGILNATPDSFSDGGRFNTVDAALRRAEQMIADGADILDIGGESTRPGFTAISSELEIERVVPIISAIKQRFDIPVSCDTYKAEVASAALSSGADMINDIWGLKADNALAGVIANADAAVCLMHNRKDCIYMDLLSDITRELSESVAIAKSAGIRDDAIMLDVGIGFAKTTEDNLKVTKNLKVFTELGYPLLYGASRKSMIGKTLNLPENERLEGTLATSVIACLSGARFVRVHDVKENKRAIMMARAIIK